MRDIEALHQPDPEHGSTADAKARLDQVLTDAHERREKLQRQLAMADEFIDVLDQQLA